MQVVNLTTPAQIFHCLRRQVRRPFRKPLVIMTPKSLLRHKRATSTLSEITEGRFQRVVPDHTLDEDALVVRAILCTGKVYYDLLAHREQMGDVEEQTAIIRVEQLYPFPADEIREALSGYDFLHDVVWVQEEPENMGPYYFLHPRLTPLIDDMRKSLRWVTRQPSASPATGSKKAHVLEQSLLMSQAFGSEP